MRCWAREVEGKRVATEYFESTLEDVLTGFIIVMPAAAAASNRSTWKLQDLFVGIEDSMLNKKPIPIWDYDSFMGTALLAFIERSWVSQRYQVSYINIGFTPLNLFYLKQQPNFILLNDSYIRNRIRCFFAEIHCKFMDENI